MSAKAPLDQNGELVHVFQLEMRNLGFARMEERLVSMLDSGVWRTWSDGLGSAAFEECEFDYFLTAIGVDRDHVIKGVADLDVKARLDEHMDETRTGESDRRPLEQVRADMPNRNIEPFGWTESERKALQNATGHGVTAKRPALGSRVRHYRRTGENTFAREGIPRIDRLIAQLGRLDADELDRLTEEIRLERKRRR